MLTGTLPGGHTLPVLITTHTILSHTLMSLESGPSKPLGPTILTAAYTSSTVPACRRWWHTQGCHRLYPESASQLTPVPPTRGSPLVVRVNGDSVLLPCDQGIGKPMDLALEAGYTTLLTHDGLGVHVEVGHSWGDRRGKMDKVHCGGAEGES